MGEAAGQGRYYRALDGLRGLSVLAVVWHHARPLGFTSELSTRGYLGVDVFFVISGFLITTLLVREEARSGSVSLGRFWVRRALRLWPLWYAILTALALVFWLVIPNAAMAAPFWRDLPWNATYTSNLIVPGTFLALSWSLAVEEQFYIVWPLVWTKVRSAATPLLVFLGGLSVAVHLGLLDAVLVDAFGPIGAQALALKATVLPLILGCAAALGIEQLRWLTRGALAPLLAAVLVAVAALPAPVTEGQMRLVAQVFAAGLVVTCVGVNEPRWLMWKPLCRIGERAYGVYLLHLFALQLVMSLGPWQGGSRGWGGFFFAAVLGVAFAAVSYRWLESPFLRLKKRFSAV
ncbi:MAG: acyltransferase [Planctomycetota bacterium]